MCDKMRTHCRSLLSLFIEMVSLQVTYTKKSLKQLLALPVYSNWKSTAMDASIEHPLRSSSMPSHISRLVKSGLRPRTDSIYNNIKNMIITSIPTNSSRNRGAGSHRCHTNILLQTRIPGDFACKWRKWAKSSEVPYVHQLLSTILAPTKQRYNNPFTVKEVHPDVLSHFSHLCLFFFFSTHFAIRWDYSIKFFLFLFF